MVAKQKFWLTIAIVNLLVVAILGLVLRSKIVFEIPFLDFKYLLHAHSHFAFGGWVTLSLLTLLVYELLPESKSGKAIYGYLLSGIFICSVGMLVSFLIQGYALFSITFSTLFIFVTYIFSIVFLRDFLKTKPGNLLKILIISSLTYLVLSSIGQFTLAFLMINMVHNLVLYKDAIYTYLHLQYNGFFSLTIFALFFNRILKVKTINEIPYSNIFARLLSFTIIPSLFLSYLWHYPQLWIRIVAIIGSLSIVVCCIYFFRMLEVLKLASKEIEKISVTIWSIAFSAFLFKMIFQSLTIFPVIGEHIFTNRPIIIGFLHLVLLGFVSLYLLAHFVENGFISSSRSGRNAIWFFAFAVIANEAVLMLQGLGFMFMISGNAYPKVLWFTALLLFLSAFNLLFQRNKNNLISQH